MAPLGNSFDYTTNRHEINALLNFLNKCLVSNNNTNVAILNITLIPICNSIKIYMTHILRLRSPTVTSCLQDVLNNLN